jgi:hypothetical protein
LAEAFLAEAFLAVAFLGGSGSAAAPSPGPMDRSAGAPVPACRGSLSPFKGASPCPCASPMVLGGGVDPLPRVTPSAPPDRRERSARHRFDTTFRLSWMASSRPSASTAGEPEGELVRLPRMHCYCSITELTDRGLPLGYGEVPEIVYTYHALGSDSPLRTLSCPWVTRGPALREDWMDTLSGVDDPMRGHRLIQWRCRGVEGRATVLRA